MSDKIEAQTMTSAIYARVSTDKQTVENQLEALGRLATARGHTPEVITETESGAKRRPALEALIARARRGEVRTIYVWALDRLGRGGALEALQIMADLDRCGCALVSLQESWLDTSATNPLRDVLVAFSATVAKMERQRLIERTKAGLERARRAGKRLGAPRVNQLHLLSAVAMVEAGASYREAAAKWNVGATTIRDAIRARGTQS